MISSYFKLAVRLMIYHPFFSIINVLGLSTGFAVFFMLWPFTLAELKSDQFIEGHENIFRLTSEWQITNVDETSAEILIVNFGSSVGNELRMNSKDVDVTRIQTQREFEPADGLKDKLVIRATRDGNTAVFSEEHAIIADSNLFTFFRFPLSEGSAETALSQPHSVAISKSRAQTIFGKGPAINKMIDINDTPYVIGGVFEDLPRNSHLQFDLVLSNLSMLTRWNSKGRDAWVGNYMKLTSPDPSAVLLHLNERKGDYASMQFKLMPNLQLLFTSMPLRDIAFMSNAPSDSFKTKSKLMLTILGAVSILVLIMAWINYINLTVARTSSRFKEMAARKVAGAKVGDIFLQFLCQSLIINLIAVVMGLTLVQLARVPFQMLFGIYVLPFKLDLLGLFSLVFLLGVVTTACYPAYTIIRYSAKQLTTGKTPARNMTVSSTLAVVQYTSAIVLISWIFVVYFQLDMILDKDIGLRKDNVLVFDGPSISDTATTQKKMMSLAKQLKMEQGVVETALSSSVPGDLGLFRDFKRHSTSVVNSLRGTSCDEEFISLYQLQIVSGRAFVPDERDSVIILSENATRTLGFASPEEAVGARIHYFSNTPEEQQLGWRKFEVIGIIADYRIAPYLATSDDGDVGSFLLFNDKSQRHARVSVHVDTENLDEVVTRLEGRYRETFPGNPPAWYFVDDNVNQHYFEQKIARNQIIFFTILAIAVACLGLLGMISNKVVEKTKEIGVRRILGAGIGHIFRIVLTSTVKQVLFAMVIALPTAYYIGTRYVEIFSERVEIRWWYYAAPVSILLGVMVATISSVLWRAAHSNPVEALRHE